MPVTPNSIIYPQALDITSAVATAAKTTYSDTTNAVQITFPTAVGNGALIKKVRAYPRATVTATQIILWLTKSSDSTNTNPVPIATALMAPYTLAQTTQLPSTDFGLSVNDPVRIGPGDKLWFSAGVALAAGIVCVVEYEPL